ncbi:peptide MFS transporter [Novosphingobium sp. 1949]|uniref:Peptide MFS transporter n=1 Tax=Novosphingobium organovorum TaxID=2930092 RepID=A0ABT0BD94_9SPHN|nr:peptide MFS transporter [Novosphingobium organovorum]MCJ2183042.1 peptide MFS transporter [Novosphingobium organovorum]
MTASEASPEITLPHDPLHADKAFFGHPKGLAFLSAVEGCERFSYYSMQTLLVLYMTQYLLLPAQFHTVIGLGWLQKHWFNGLEGQPLASEIFGTYTSLVYLTPIFGGLIADRLLGRRATLVAGGIIMALGHFLMAIQGAFLFALLALIVGVGLFKGNIASQVGELYKPSDMRRAMAFQLFYIAINVSVIIAPPITGTLGQRVGWHWGFGAAGVVMALGLIVYVIALPWLPKDAPRGKARQAAQKSGHVGAFSRKDLPRLAALAVLVPVLAVSLLPNQQISNVYLVWGDARFDLTLFGFAMPSTWLVGIDAGVSFFMLVAVAVFWKLFERRYGWQPDDLAKMAIGSVFTVAGSLCLVAAAASDGPHKISLVLPLLFHTLNGIGFAIIMPVSLALFTKVAPRALNATVVGIYYLAFVATNYAVGVIGGLYSSISTEAFWMIHVGAAAIGLVAFTVLKPILSGTLASIDAEVD